MGRLILSKKIGRASEKAPVFGREAAMGNADKGWLTSKEARRQLGVTSCELAHLRQEGKLAFQKQGNAYMYREDECVMSKAERTTKGRRPR